MTTDITTSKRPKVQITRSTEHTEALQSWAALDVDPTLFEDHEPDLPVPGFVHLSRLIEAAPVDVVDLANVTRSDTPDQWADSLGRPLYQIGLAALVAATAVGVFTFAPLPSQTLAEVVPEAVGAGSQTPAGPQAEQGSPTEHAGLRPMAEMFGAQQAGADGADLAIVGTATADSGQIRWTATVRNQGPGIASQPVRLIHTIPDELNYVSSAGSDWECIFNAEASTIACDLRTELGIGQRRQLGIVTTDGGATSGTKLPSTMAVVGRNSDSDLSNNAINVVAVAAGKRSRSTGDASDGDSTSVSAQTNDTPTEDQLPKTGAGLTAILAATGLGMCLSGRRLLRLSNQMQPIS